jgi:peroxiredoxin
MSTRKFNMDVTTLTQQLADYKAGFISRAPAERLAMMESATSDLKATGIETSALQVGDQAPDITLTDAKGQLIRLTDLWKDGLTVLIFYRGGWCPYCNLELRAWQQQLGALAKLGGRLVAISPQTPDNSLSTAEKNELLFPVLSDSELKATNGFGIGFEMPQPLIDLYSKVGNDLPVLNGNGRWVLPLPATYVIGRDGIICFAHIESDYRLRAEPADVLSAIAAHMTLQIDGSYTD